MQAHLSSACTFTCDHQQQTDDVHGELGQVPMCEGGVDLSIGELLRKTRGGSLSNWKYQPFVWRQQSPDQYQLASQSHMP